MEPLRVVAGGDQQAGSGIGADTVKLEQRRSGLFEERNEGMVDCAHLSGETCDASRQSPNHDVRGVGNGVRSLAGPHRGGFGDQTGLVSVVEPDPDLLGSTEHQDIDVRLARLHGEAHQVASRMGVLDLIREDHVHATVAEAVDAALEMLTHSPDDA